ncbi:MULTISPECIES: phosphopantetheine-binding protein [Dickeya]|uniref:phosphopantetheine-binding protein n=1 Tax=Dickeya TaxID=204037 RepID=UPI0005505E33|nr:MULTISPECIES: phosphopantetheine-binding protein [Dickeya]
MDKLKYLLKNVFGVSESDAQDNKTLENMDLDSICIIEFQIEIERTFNIDEGQLALISSDTLQTIMERVRGLQPVELKDV